MNNILSILTFAIGVISLAGYSKYIKYIISISKEMDITEYFEFFIVSLVCITSMIILFFASYFYYKPV